LICGKDAAATEYVYRDKVRDRAGNTTQDGGKPPVPAEAERALGRHRLPRAAGAGGEREAMHYEVTKVALPPAVLA
jgi:hypothetical protein